MRYALALLALFAAPADDFPKPYNSEDDKGEPVSAAEAAKLFRMPTGMKVEVFASEPEVRNPIAMAWDGRGRMWVAENYTYSEYEKKFDLSLRDRVLILEDADNDGRAEGRKVFSDDVQRLTSVEVGLDGVWLMAPPQLLFIPDRDHDDKPDGPAQVILDGFDVPAENYHNFANGLRWGPDGWLYGRCGASSPGKVGVPGSTKEQRIPLTGGLWRFHPARKTFEALAHGTTNPWGHDWTALGEPLFINTVNGHLWHAVPGMHFVRPHTLDPNRYAYEMLDHHADHWHFDSTKDWTDSRSGTGVHGERGGGHAHSGMMIYQGDNWPESERGKLFTLNFHGRRVNKDRIEREGSGLVGRHEPDPIFAGDKWFRGIEITYGPDGGVYVLDWSDTGECHENTGVHRTSGRIYKFTLGEAKRPEVGDVAKLSEADLVALHGHASEWFVRAARRELADRAARGEGLPVARSGLRRRFDGQAQPVEKLRALWTLHAIGGADEALLTSLLKADHESLRAWGVRLLTDALPIDTADGRRPAGPDPGVPIDLSDEFTRMGHEDPSGLVRLYLASTLQRLPVAKRMGLAYALMLRGEDARDHNLPLLVWYGVIPVAGTDPMGLASATAASCRLEATRRLVARRLAEEPSKHAEALGFLVEATARGATDAVRIDVLNGMAEGLRGWRKAEKPDRWDTSAALLAKSEDKAVRERARELSVLFGDGRALDEVRALAMDPKGNLESRRSALRSLIEARPDDLRATCEKLLGTRFLNTTAVGGLALFNDPAIGRSLAASYSAFHPSERSAVIDALASRPAFAGSLLDAVAKGAIPKEDVSAFHARQIRSMGDADLSSRLAEAWGEIRDSPADKAARIADLKARLTTEALAVADMGRGRETYNKLCASCHRLYGHGGEIGPDLTGSGRSDLDYVLGNVIDPSATVGADFRMVVAALTDGRVLNGIVKAKTEKTISLQTQTEAITVPLAEVEALKPSPLSLMPEGQMDPLKDEEIRDLVAYLMNKTQVPLPGGGR